MQRRSEQPLVNLPMVMKTMGWLLIIESLFMLVPMGVALWYDESDWIPFLGSSLATSFTGILMTRFIRPTHSRMSRREGFLLTSIVWVAFSLFGMLPLLFCVRNLSISDAFFETMSGFTTTGATVISPDTVLTHAVHIWRALTQWIGGMGIILFTLAVVPMLNSSGGMQMFNAEVTGITHDKVRPRISQTAKALWLTYFILTIGAALMLWAGPMDLFDSICHAFGTLSTGGYTTSPNGISAYNSPYIYLTLTIFMFLGGVNFGMIIRSVTQSPKAALRNEVLCVFIGSILVAFVFFVAALVLRFGYDDWQLLSVKPLFQIVSVFTSTGYTVSGFASWGYFTLGLIFIMMFVGGCAGSTSGGAKIDRIIFLAKYCRNEVARCIHPNAILPITLNGKVQPPAIVSKVIAFLCIFVLLIVAGAIAIMMCGVDPIHSFFASFSCVTNTGISASDTFYGSDFAMMPETTRWIMSVLMLVGRLEVYTVIILLIPGFWRR